MAHPFLSDEWIADARAIRERHAGSGEPISLAVTVNMVVTDTPFGDDPIISHIDTSAGEPVLELGHLEIADVTVTTDYETSKLIFVSQDAAAAMQAFMSGKVVVQGDMMKLMTLQAVLTTNPAAAAIGDEIRAITA